MGADESAEKRRAAAALRYVAGEQEAPEVVAAGRGRVAEQLLAAARRHGIPVYENAELAAALVRLDVGSEIPEELYLAVAEVLAFVFALESRAAGRTVSPEP